LQSFLVKEIVEIYSFENAKINTLYYVPDVNYYKEDLPLYQDYGNLFYEDVRPYCHYTDKSVIPNPPNDPPLNWSETTVYYSILNTLGDTVQSERKMTCDENEIARFCGGNLTILTTMLPEGEYKLVARIIMNGKEANKTIKFASENNNGTLGFVIPGKNAPQMEIQSVGMQIHIYSSQPKSFAIINSMGRIVQKGFVNGTSIAIVSPGTYWVKVGSETRRVQVFN